MADENKRAGWYPDPDGAAGERWWNGASWSDSRRGGVVPAAAPVVAAAASVAPIAPAAPVIYSAANPAPQSPGAYGTSRSALWTNALITAAPGRNIDARVNKYAFYGFICGIISLFFNLFFVLSILAIVFSALGISRARQLKAQGAPSTLMNLALVGLGAGLLSTGIAVFGFVIFVVSSFTGIVS